MSKLTNYNSLVSEIRGSALSEIFRDRQEVLDTLHAWELSLGRPVTEGDLESSHVAVTLRDHYINILTSRLDAAESSVRTLREAAHQLLSLAKDALPTS